MLRGALAAAVTPLREDGAALDEEAFGPYLEFLATAGLDGILALGTTGEGILLSAAERRRAAELFLAGPLPAIAHCGAQTTAETAALAEHAAGAGAAGVAVISPPYYALDDESLLAHLATAARACTPTPFYVYEFQARSGYAVPLPVLERLRGLAPNLAGLKVSDKPFEAVEPYLLEGLDVFVGAEDLVLAGLERGSAGAVSGLASVFPERVVALVRDRAGHVSELRRALDRYPFQAAAKFVLGRRGVPVREDVRLPLRRLNDEEKRELDAWLESL
ncbi:MAG TPA: dihydrodipicolinate synthase family protein [Gaiellaceae bacterium]|nr:dihydrodipicolinate synthase family protein [Gaiellaceae bacterium]